MPSYWAGSVKSAWLTSWPAVVPGPMERIRYTVPCETYPGPPPFTRWAEMRTFAYARLWLQPVPRPTIPVEPKSAPLTDTRVAPWASALRPISPANRIFHDAEFSCFFMLFVSPQLGAAYQASKRGLLGLGQEAPGWAIN